MLKALAKKPEDRQRDMAAFIYELRTLMDMLGIGRRRNMPRAANSVNAAWRAAATSANQRSIAAY